MKRRLGFGLLLMVAVLVSAHAQGFELRGRSDNPVKSSPALQLAGLSQSDAPADDMKLCDGVPISRNLSYGPNKLNVLDVASTTRSGDSNPRAVLLFVAGESFTGERSDTSGPALDQAMCFAARHKLIGVTMSYRVAPASRWPAGAQDVAAAISWIRENIDLFGGDPNQIVAIGYSVGAFHVASLLAHRELQHPGQTIAGLALVSGLYRAGSDPSPAAKSYFGDDAGKYVDKSIFPGILGVDSPMLLAWSSLDPPSIIEESEQLRDLLCKAHGVCPRTNLLRKRATLTSLVDDLDAPILELVREVEARGLP